MSSEAALKDSFEIPEIGSFTVYDSVDSSGNAQDVTTVQMSPSINTLTVDQAKAIFIEDEPLKRGQVMNGNLYAPTAEQAFQQLRNEIDKNLTNYLAGTTAWTTGTAATYHDNVAGDALTRADLIESIATMKATDGAHDLALFLNPFAVGNLMSLAEFIPNYQAAEQGVLGIPRVGFFYGTPVYETNSVRNGRTVSATASAIASNVLTCTVAAGHGIVAGMKIKTSGGSANVTTAAAVTSTTSTTVVVPLTSGDNATNGALTITIDSCENMLLDLPHVFLAWQKMPSVRVVPDPDRTSDVIQIATVFGRYARTGKVRFIHSPKDSID